MPRSFMPLTLLKKDFCSIFWIFSANTHFQRNSTSDLHWRAIYIDERSTCRSLATRFLAIYWLKKSFLSKVPIRQFFLLSVCPPPMVSYWKCYLPTTPKVRCLVGWSVCHNILIRVWEVILTCSFWVCLAGFMIFASCLQRIPSSGTRSPDGGYPPDFRDVTVGIGKLRKSYN